MYTVYILNKILAKCEWSPVFAENCEVKSTLAQFIFATFNFQKSLRID